MFGLGSQELLLILLLALFFFGVEKLPDIARGLGQGLREFQRASEGKVDDEYEHGKRMPDRLPGSAGSH
jgi:sec-independent protein translocase protein TatA